MNSGKFLFAQLMDLIHPQQFQRCVDRYKGNYKVKTFYCWEQFLCMAFGQVTFRDSLHDIEVCLQSRVHQLYHLGIRSRVSHSTLADANAKRDWQIYADLAQTLIKKARNLYQDETLAVELDETVYALDSTTIDLCLNLFPWARFRRTKSGVKLHTLLDLRGAIPTFIGISQAKQADVSVLDDLVLEAGSFYVFDRGYLDFKRLFCFVQAGANYVTRAKHGIKFTRLKSNPVSGDSTVQVDQIVRLQRSSSYQNYPEKLRRIRFFDPETSQTLIFLTNNFRLSAELIAQLYKQRWRIELFFKWIKQNLRIKHFFGNSENAVKTQIWIAVCVYVLVALARKSVGSELRLSQIIQILSVNAFEKEPLQQILTKAPHNLIDPCFCNQLMLWD